MLRIGALLIAVLLQAFAGSATAQDPPPLFPEPQACAAQADDPTILDKEKARWTDCEKWVRSCLRQGLEANLFSKSACQTPRATETVELRQRLRLAPFVKPERYAETNLLSGAFLVAVVTNPHYSSQLASVGVRIFGGYFNDPINLENHSTNVNLVVDASIMRRGVRLTNFKTDKNLSFDGSNVRGSIHLMRSRIQGSLFMEACVYDYVDMNDAKIGASFEGSSSVFNDDLRMHRADIDGKVILTKARITTLRAGMRCWDPPLRCAWPTCASASISPALTSRATCACRTSPSRVRKAPLRPVATGILNSPRRMCCTN